MQMIPAIWRIDVEPDDFRPVPNRTPWNGFVTMAALVERLRPCLADCSGAVVHPSWFLRFDPDIARCYGQADFVVTRYRGLMDQLRAHGDPLGIHVHYYRWDSERQIAYSDHADVDWTTHCMNVAAEAFARCFGESVRRSSQGAYFLGDAIVDHAITLGIEVDVTAEPGLPAQIDDASFGAYTTAPSPDFRHFPRRPYYPSRSAVGTPARSPADRRPLLIVPLTAYDYPFALAPWSRRFAKTLLRRPHQPLPLNPWKTWSDPRTYWDLVARAVDEGPARYLAFAIRTDAPHSRPHLQAKALLECLPTHPIARRLRFIDPLSPEILALAGGAPPLSRIPPGSR